VRNKKHRWSRHKEEVVWNDYKRKGVIEFGHGRRGRRDQELLVKEKQRNDAEK